MTSRAPSDADEPARIDAASLPEEVRRLWETMLRLDPTWDLNKWLVDQARDELGLVEAKLGRERMRLEQRLHRVNALTERLKRMGVSIDEVRWTDPHQRNLFDIFSGAEAREEPVTGATPTEEQAEGIENVELHPAGALLDWLPGEPGDDPLLAIVAQLVLVEMDEAEGSGDLPLSLEEICEVLETRGISPDELIEAINWLLERGDIIEVAEDLFGYEMG